MAPASDPSTFEKHPELPGQASTAALYVTHPERVTNVRELHPSEADQKLSSAGASTSLKYAKKQDLPSYPIVGTDIRTSAGTAANLANSHQKSPSLWKPGISASAGKAALLATNVKSKQLWQPELSAAGSKAALVAHRDGGKVELWAPEQTKEGNRAAGAALRMKGLAPELDYGYTPDGHEKALVAATGAVSTTTRPRSGSTPNPPLVPRPSSSHGDSTISRGALNAATVAHQPSVSHKTRAYRSSFTADSAALEAARVQHLGRNVPREMFGEHPPVKLEIEEKRRKDAIHASAVSMAKQMNDVIQKKGYPNQAATPGSAGRIAVNKAQSGRTAQAATAADDLRQQALQYIHLQEAARRSATERLKKLYTDDEAAFRDYYGYSPAPPQRSRLSVIGRPRGRASSESHPRRRRLRDDGGGVASSDDDDDDEQVRVRVLRSQRQPPTSFKAQMAPHYDEKKRQQDRVNLLAVAQRNVQSSLTSIDKRVYDETGKVPQSTQKEWEAKAKAKARANAESEARVAAMTHGKVDVGGGRFVDQAEVDAIASKRVQPTLDEITERAEMQRHEEAERRRLALVQKEQEANLKMVMKKEKEEARARKSEEKHTHRDGKLKSIFSGKKSSGAITSGEHAHTDTKAEGPAVAVVDADATTGIENHTDNTASIASHGLVSGPGTSKAAAVVPSTEITVAAQPSTSAKVIPTDTQGPEAAKEDKSSLAASPVGEQLPRTEATKSEPVAKSEPKVLNVLFNRLKRKPKHEESSKTTAAAAPAPAAASVVMAETSDGSAVVASATKEGNEKKQKGSTAAAGLSPVDPTSTTPMSTLASEDASTKAIISSHQPSPPPSPSPRQPARTSASSVSSLSESHLAAALAGDSSHSAGVRDKVTAKDDTVIEPAGGAGGEDGEQEKRSRFARSVAEPRDKDSDNEFEDAKETKDPRESTVTTAPTTAPTSVPLVAAERNEKGQEAEIAGLAPPRASFASRTKSESPARDSKFQEQL